MALQIFVSWVWSKLCLFSTLLHPEATSCLQAAFRWTRRMRMTSRRFCLSAAYLDFKFFSSPIAENQLLHTLGFNLFLKAWGRWTRPRPSRPRDNWKTHLLQAHQLPALQHPAPLPSLRFQKSQSRKKPGKQPKHLDLWHRCKRQTICPKNVWRRRVTLATYRWLCKRSHMQKPCGMKWKDSLNSLSVLAAFFCDYKNTIIDTFLKTSGVWVLDKLGFFPSLALRALYLKIQAQITAQKNEDWSKC